MAFPVPALLPLIEDLLFEVQWLEGLILVTDSQSPAFVSKSQVENLLLRLCKYPNGKIVSQCLKESINKRFTGKCSYKPVLLLHSNGRFWLGIMGIGHGKSKLTKEVTHLNRCLKLA